MILNEVEAPRKGFSFVPESKDMRIFIQERKELKYEIGCKRGRRNPGWTREGTASRCNTDCFFQKPRF